MVIGSAEIVGRVLIGPPLVLEPRCLSQRGALRPAARVTWRSMWWAMSSVLRNRYRGDVAEVAGEVITVRAVRSQGDDREGDACQLPLCG